MKKVILLFFVAFLYISSFGQNRDDQTAILQQCIDHSEIQKCYPTDDEGKPKQLTIYYWHPLLFPLDLGVTKGGKSIQYLVMSEKSEINETSVFFKKFMVTNDTATANFEFSYKKDNRTKTMQLNLDFIKTEGVWKITDSSIRNNQ